MFDSRPHDAVSARLAIHTEGAAFAQAGRWQRRLWLRCVHRLVGSGVRLRSVRAMSGGTRRRRRTAHRGWRRIVLGSAAISALVLRHRLLWQNRS